jgi:hypothetical protein
MAGRKMGDCTANRKGGDLTRSHDFFLPVYSSENQMRQRISPWLSAAAQIKSSHPWCPSQNQAFKVDERASPETAEDDDDQAMKNMDPSRVVLGRLAQKWQKEAPAI